MRALALSLGLLVLAVGAAGCLDGDEPTDARADVDEASQPSSGNASAETGNETSSEPVAEGPQVEVAWFNGTVRGQSAPLLGPVCVETCDNQFGVEVSENTTTLLGEISWEAEASLMFDLDIPYDRCEASTQEDCPPEAVSGAEGYLSIPVRQASDIVAGNWTAAAWAHDSPAEPVEFTIVVAQADGELPDDHALLDG